MEWKICCANSKIGDFLSVLSDRELMKSILVTGAMGFIGRHVIDILSKQPITIHATFLNNKPMISHKNIIWHNVDLLSEKQVDHLLVKTTPTDLLHLAWFAKQDEYWTSYVNLDWLKSSIHLLNQFIQCGGKRAVYVGSCAEYEWGSEYFHEKLTRCYPSTLYGSCKHALYLVAEKIAEKSNISFAWARLFFLFGVHENPNRLISSAITTLLQKKKFVIKNADQLLDFMDVSEAASALVGLLFSDVKGAVNIGSGQPMTIQELVGMIARKLQASASVECHTTHKKPITANVDRLTEEVKWMPALPVAESIDKAIAWWGENLHNKIVE